LATTEHEHEQHDLPSNVSAWFNDGHVRGCRDTTVGAGGVPIGLQLYTVGEEMNRDPAATLNVVAGIGYKQVELVPLLTTPAKDLKRMLDDVGLKNPSGHHSLPDLIGKLPETIELAHLFGQEFVVVTTPWVADVYRFKPDPALGRFGLVLAVTQGLTLDDWKWNADQFNKIGEQVKKAGLQLAFHNHPSDWKSYGDVTGYDEFLRLTDASLVHFELDCGWATVAGQDPIAYLTKYPERYRLLHLKDFRRGFTPSTTITSQSELAAQTELGRGAIDYSKILSAARKARIRGQFVEHDPPITEMPALQAIKIDYEYVNALK
jgi:sugar phosphate isomerase/epimerase